MSPAMLAGMQKILAQLNPAEAVELLGALFGGGSFRKTFTVPAGSITETVFGREVTLQEAGTVTVTIGGLVPPEPVVPSVSASSAIHTSAGPEATTPNRSNAV